MSDDNVIAEAHRMLHDIQWAEDHEDTWPNNPLEVVAMLQKVTRYASFLESRLYEDPTPPPAPAVDAAPVGDIEKPSLSVMRSRLEGIHACLLPERTDMKAAPDIALREIMYLLEDLVDIYAEQQKGQPQS